MDPIPCFSCGDYFPSSPRHKSQRYCKKPKCQRAKKAEWQRHKMHTDPEYKAGQRQSHQEWLRANPNYWKGYRKRHPEKAERNRILQIIRNRRRRKPEGSDADTDTSLIAKMDASKRNDFGLVGQFWLVPVIAKMDASKIVLRQIPAGYD
ncbi:MAG: hypothetical protein JRC68_09545 [Deltaproteobacteria bacterium]|nr:hypothetical protein [Deltaproteobacteria bacterium]